MISTNSYNCGLQRREQGQDLSDDLKLGIELTPDNEKEITSGESLDNQDLSKDTKNDNQGLSEETDARNLWSLFPLIKLSELTPDEQSERVNLFLIGFVSIILMNAMAVLIIVIAKNSNYEVVIKSSINKRPIKGRDLMTPFFQLKVRAWLEKPYFYLVQWNLDLRKILGVTKIFLKLRFFLISNTRKSLITYINNR